MLQVLLQCFDAAVQDVPLAPTHRSDLYTAQRIIGGHACCMCNDCRHECLGRFKIKAGVFSGQIAAVLTHALKIPKTLNETKHLCQMISMAKAQKGIHSTHVWPGLNLIQSSNDRFMRV